MVNANSKVGILGCMASEAGGVIHWYISVGGEFSTSCLKDMSQNSLRPYMPRRLSK